MYDTRINGRQNIMKKFRYIISILAILAVAFSFAAVAASAKKVVKSPVAPTYVTTTKGSVDSGVGGAKAERTPFTTGARTPATTKAKSQNTETAATGVRNGGKNYEYITNASGQKIRVTKSSGDADSKEVVTYIDDEGNVVYKDERDNPNSPKYTGNAKVTSDKSPTSPVTSAEKPLAMKLLPVAVSLMLLAGAAVVMTKKKQHA